MNKHIEEMAKDICIAETEYMVAMVTADIDDVIDGAAQRNERLATELYEKGYRKASTVASDIFEEIEGIILSKMPDRLNLSKKERGYAVGVILGRRDAFLDVINNLAELKKKYESENNNG
jgi:hypothetical protein